MFSAPDAQVLVGMLTLLGALAALWVQNRRTHRDNRNDHAETAAKVDLLVAGQAEIKDDLREVRADVRHHGDRLRSLEQLAAPPTKPTSRARKKAS